MKVARAKGEKVPEGCFVNADGELVTDPEEYYANPPGALLPFGGHKGYALSVFADILAGALSGAGCSKGDPRVANAMLAVFLDPKAFAGEEFYSQETEALVQRVKDCPTMQGVDEILLPGEPEERVYKARSESGIAIEEATWKRIADLALERNVAVPTV